MSEENNQLVELLQNSDKAEFLDFANDFIKKAKKGMLIYLTPGENGTTVIQVKQFGFNYLFEVQGFTDMVANDTDLLFSNGSDI